MQSRSRLISRFVLARRSTAEQYRAAPFGAYLVLPRALVFCARPTLWGFAVWGEPNVADIATLTALVARDIAPDVPSHTTFVDLRGLELGDPSAFQPLIDHTRAQRAACGARVTRLAVVRPTGLLGMTVAGYFQVIQVPYSVGVFDDFAQAAAWVGGSDLSAALDELTSRARGVPAWLAHLRTWLEDHARDATIEDAARVLARSRRSLQLDLARSSSSFRRELTRRAFASPSTPSSTAPSPSPRSLTTSASPRASASAPRFDSRPASHRRAGAGATATPPCTSLPSAALEALPAAREPEIRPAVRRWPRSRSTGNAARLASAVSTTRAGRC